MSNWDNQCFSNQQIKQGIPGSSQILQPSVRDSPSQQLESLTNHLPVFILLALRLDIGNKLDIPRPNTNGILLFGVAGSRLQRARGKPPVSRRCLNRHLVNYFSTRDRQDLSTITIGAYRIVSNINLQAITRKPGAGNQGHILVLFAHLTNCLLI